MGFISRKSGFGAYKQQRRRPAAWNLISTFFFFLLYRQYDSLAFYRQHFNILASLCNQADKFVPLLVANPKCRFSCKEAKIIDQPSEPQCDKTNKVAVTTRKNSDQLGHSPSLIRLPCSPNPWLPIEQTVKIFIRLICLDKQKKFSIKL